MALPEIGVVKQSCLIEQQQPAATQTTRNTSIAADPPTSQQLTHSKPQQQPQDVHEGVSNKRKRNDKASYRPDSIPELIHEQEATLHTGNDGSPGPAREGAAAKSDNRTTLTNRLSGDTKISPLTTQQQVGKPEYRRLNLRDWEKHPHEITTPSATHSFAMGPASDSAHVTITEYNVLGRQLMNGQGNRRHWWKSLT